MTDTGNRIIDANPELKDLGHYAYGWRDEDDKGLTAERGLNEDVVRNISRLKEEPEWMPKRRLKAFRLYDKKPLPSWGADLSTLPFDDIKYFVRSTEGQAQTWEDLPEDIRIPMTAWASPRRRSSVWSPASPRSTNPRSS